MNAQEFLEHHGVKGMRWGVRKDRRSSSSSSSSSGSKHKPAHELSDEDLKKAIERMNLEQQYKNLVSPKAQPKNSEAAAFVKDMGKTLLKNAVNTAGQTAINKVIKKG